MACGGPRGAEPHPSCRRVGGPRPSQPPLTVPGLPPGRLVVELSGTSHILPFPGWPCRGPLHPGRSGHPREDRPGWLVLGWTSRQRPARGGGGRCPAALHAGRTGSGSGLGRQPRGWLSTTCRAGPPRVPARAARRLEPAPGSAGPWAVCRAGSALRAAELTPGPGARVRAGGCGDRRGRVLPGARAIRVPRPFAGDCWYHIPSPPRQRLKQVSVGQTSVYAVDENGKSFPVPRGHRGLGFPERPDGMMPSLPPGP